MKQILSLALALMAGAITSEARMVRGFDSASDDTLGFKVDSIDYRKDLTRVYGRLTGRPHTSARIDGVSMTVGASAAMECTDIDGVDFNRYFQWEDGGEVCVELDFAPVRPARSGSVTFATPRGKSVTQWQTTGKKK